MIYSHFSSALSLFRLLLLSPFSPFPLYTANVAEDPALCAVFLTIISVMLIVVSLPFSLFFCVKVITPMLLLKLHHLAAHARRVK